MHIQFLLHVRRTMFANLYVQNTLHTQVHVWMIWTHQNREIE